MQKLAEICVRRPIFAAVLILILVVVGGFGFTKLGVDRFPRIENPTVTVSTSYTGASPEAVETEITDLIESSVNTISGIDELRSTSSEGRSSVTVTFQLDKDPDIATSEVRDKVGLVQGRLPDDVDPPTIRKQDPDSSPIIGIALSSNAPIREVTEYADKVLRPQLENANGVGEVLVNGGRLRQINILPDPYKMRSVGVTVNDLIRTVQQGNVEVPGGEVETRAGDLTLRTQGRVKNVAEFGRLVIKGEGAALVRVDDVARVEDGEAEATTGAELNSKPSVLLFIRKQSGVNTLATIEEIKHRLEDMKPQLAQNGYSVQIVRDQSKYIEAAVHSVEEHLIIGSILATLVVLIFLLNWRATLISAISIPASIIATFGLMWAFGYTLNIITLLALTLAVGIVIDDAIVVIENIYRVMDERGMSAADAAIEGTREIGLAVLATTLSLVAVFLPVAFMEGLTGRFLSSFGITMSFAIMVSLLVSFTLAPSLGARWLKSHKKGGHAEHNGGNPGAHDSHTKQTGFFGVIDRVYTGMLHWSMTHRWVIVLACLGALATIPTLYSMAPFNLLPEDDESQFQVSARAPEGTSLEQMSVLGRKLADEVRKQKEVDYTLLTINGWGPTASTNNADIFVGLTDVKQRNRSQDEIAQGLRRQLNRKFRSEGLQITVRALNALPGMGGGGGGRGVQYVLSGPDLETLRDAADKMMEEVKDVPGVADVDTNFVAGKPEFVADVDRDLASSLGVSVNDVANALRYVVGGQQVTTYNEKGEQYEVHIRAPKGYRADREGISMWTVASSTNGAVNLDQVTKFRKGTGPVNIQRLNRQRQIIVTASQIPGSSAAAILAGMDTAFKKLDLPAGYTGKPTGSSKEQNSFFAAFGLALLLSVIFMYLILAAQFESWIHPITILLSLPLTIPFALFSVVIFGQSLNIYSALGILLLFGVVKKNSILQVDHTNQLRERGMSRYDAIIQANRDRLRPILMTTIAFVAGMIPLVISTGTGAGTNRAIGTVIFGGQTLSLLLTLLATPVVYSLLDDLTQLIAKVRSKITGKQPEPDEKPTPFTEEVAIKSH